MLKRRRRPERAFAIIAVAAASLGCAKQETSEAKYAASDCRRVSLVDQATGDSIRGAEDIALDAARDRLFVSAYDRRGAERAARKGAQSIPQGGVYAVSFSGLTEGDESTAAASPLVRRDDIAGGLRPHGLALDPYTGDVAFINRSYQKVNDRWRMTPRIERVNADGELLAGEERDAPCAANDLLQGEREIIVSYDHEACDWRAGIEDVASLKRSGIATEDGKPLFDKASFANGIARTSAGEVVLGATRENALLVMNESSASFSVRSRVVLPGGPDNLTVSPDGAVIAAVHPSMLKIGMHRRLGWAKAPSRLVKADLDSGKVAVLFDDPKGVLFSGATVAVEQGDILVAGSATDEGLLVCKAAG
jgi:hypothetical protein